MKKSFLLLGFLALALLLSSCQSNATAKGEENDGALPTNADTSPSFVLEGVVTELGERLLVEVTRSEYTSGPHLVILTDETEIKNASGKALSREDISVGDTLSVVYNGQVMLSYPPQIVARSVTRILPSEGAR